MRMAVIGLRGIPDIMGGIETHCQQLYPRIKKNHPDSDITIIGRAPYIGDKKFTYEGVKVVPLWSPKSKYLETIIHTLISIFYARFVLKVKLVHIHAIGPGILAPWAKLLGMDVVLTHHGEDYKRQKWNSFAKTVLRVGEYLSIRFSNRVMVVGRSLTKKLQEEFGDKTKIQYVPNGMISDTFQVSDVQNVLDRLALEKDKYIIFVGRLVPEKGVSDLMRAYLGSDMHKAGYKLLVVGGADHESAYSKELKSIASTDLNIVMAGKKTGNDLRVLFSSAALFVLPSYHEGLPIALLEALSFDLRVLVSDITPNLDVGLPESCYFEVGNVANLSDALSIERIHEERPDIRSILSPYNWDDISEKAYQIIDGLS